MPEPYRTKEDTRPPFNIDSWELGVEQGRCRMELWSSGAIGESADWQERVYDFWRDVVPSSACGLLLPEEQKLPDDPKWRLYVGAWLVEGRIKHLIYTIPFHHLMSKPAKRFRMVAGVLEGYVGLLDSSQVNGHL